MREVPSRRTPRRAAWVLASAVAVLFLQGPDAVQSSATAQSPPAAESHPSGPGTIRGHLYTSESADSVAAGAEVTLVFRDAAGTLHRITSVSDAHGGYSFDHLPVAPEQSYVLRVHHFGRDFLGAPMNFDPGETLLEFDFLVSRTAQAIPPSGMPDGHPTGMGGAPPSPPQQNPVAALAIVGTVFALFGLAYLRAYRPREMPGRRRDPEREALIRDIASLDLRHARKEIEEADYRSVRASLFRKLEERARAHAPGPSRAHAQGSEAPLPFP